MTKHSPSSQDIFGVQGFLFFPMQQTSHGGFWGKGKIGSPNYHFILRAKRESVLNVPITHAFIISAQAEIRSHNPPLQTSLRETEKDGGDNKWERLF